MAFAKMLRYQETSAKFAFSCQEICLQTMLRQFVNSIKLCLLQLDNYYYYYYYKRRIQLTQCSIFFLHFESSKKYQIFQQGLRPKATVQLNNLINFFYQFFDFLTRASSLPVNSLHFILKESSER